MEEKLGRMPNRLANIEETISIIKELDEDKALAGFILIGINDRGGHIKFHLSHKNMFPITVLGAIEQYKYTFFSQEQRPKK